MKQILPLLPLVLAATAFAQDVAIDFSGATDFANNFRRAPISSGHQAAQTGSFVTITSNNVNTNAVAFVYDTTPANATVQNTFAVGLGQTISVSLDFANLSANGNASSIGFYFINPTAETTNVNFLALLNISTTNEQFRFASLAGLNDTASNGTGLGIGSAANQDAGLSTLDTVFRTVTATYTYDSPTSVTLGLIAGTVTSTRTFNSVTALDNVTIGFRISPIAGVPASTLHIDNFSITAPIPEPSAFAALAGLGVIGFAATRRRSRR